MKQLSLFILVLLLINSLSAISIGPLKITPDFLYYKDIIFAPTSSTIEKEIYNTLLIIRELSQNQTLSDAEFLSQFNELMNNTACKIRELHEIVFLKNQQKEMLKKVVIGGLFLTVATLFIIAAILIKERKDNEKEDITSDYSLKSV